MTGQRYAYYYAVINPSTGRCTQVKDTSDYVLRNDYVPIPTPSYDYLLKYYHPIPVTVTSFSDFQGKWYTDAAFQNEATELN